MSSQEYLADYNTPSGPYDNKGTAPPDETTASYSNEEKREEFGMEDSPVGRKRDKKTYNMRKISLLRVLIIMYNFTFMVLSVIIVGAGIYLLVSGNDISFSISSFLSGSIIVILVGLTILGLSVMGLVAAIFPIHLLLWLYAVFMFLVFIVAVAIGAFGFVVRNDITQSKYKCTVEPAGNTTLVQIRKFVGLERMKCIVKRSFEIIPDYTGSTVHKFEKCIHS